MIASFLSTWARILDERPAWVLMLLIAISVGAGVGLSKFEIDPDVSALLPEGSAEVELFQQANLDEEGSRTLYLLVRADDLEERLPEYIESLKLSPFLSEVHGTRDEFGGETARRAPQSPVWFLSDASLLALEERLSGPGRRAAIQESKALLQSDPLLGRDVVKNDPLGLRWVLSEAAQTALPGTFELDSPYLLVEDGSGAFLKVKGREPAFDVEFSNQLLADLEQRSAGLELTTVGGYAIAREDAARIRGDLESSMGWSIPLLLIFFLLSTRSLLVPHLYLLPTGVALFWTLGYAGWILGPMTPLAVSAAAILCGLGVDFSIHYLGRFREELGRGSARDALRACHLHTGRSLLGCWLTSSVAFLTFSFGSIPGLRDLGWLLALGLALSLLSTWTVLPLLLRRFPSVPPAKGPGFVMGAIGRLASSRLAAPISLATLLFAAGGWWSALSNGVAIDADPSHLRPAESDLSRALVKLESALGFAPEGITIALSESEDPAQIVRAAEALQAAGNLGFSNAHELRPEGQSRANRIAEFHERTRGWVDGAMADLKSAGFRPDSLRPGLEKFEQSFANTFVPHAADSAKLVADGESYWKASFHPQRTLTTRESRDQFRRDIQAAVGAPTHALDPGALGDAIGPLLAQELRKSLAGCSLLVVLVILASIGRLRPGLVAMLPVLCGVGVVLGAFHFLGWTLHPGNLLALPLLIGLGVDDGLHMVNRSLEGGADPVRTTGVDVWRTSVTTAIGFGSLVTADSPAIASLGAIVLLGTLTCFLATVVLIPWLLRTRTHA